MSDVKIIKGDNVSVLAFGQTRCGTVLEIRDNEHVTIDNVKSVGKIEAKLGDLTFVSRTVQLGRVGIDSGLLLLADPCVIAEQWKKEGSDPDLKTGTKFLNYNDCCHASDIHKVMEHEGVEQLAIEEGEENTNPGPCQINYETGRSGAGVCVPTGMGNGYYAVNGEMKLTYLGLRIVRIWIDFM